MHITPRATSIARNLLLATVFAGLAVLPGPAFAATDRHASPTGSGTACTQASPCALDTAINGAATGDRVLVPGNLGSYAVTTALQSPNPIRVVGTNGRPVVNLTNVGMTLNAGSTAKNLKLVLQGLTPGDFGLHGSSTNAVSVDNVIVHQTGDSHACYSAYGKLTNSVCWANGATGPSGDSIVELDGDNTFRNVTISGAGATGKWVGVDAFGRAPFPASVTDSFFNVIARGAGSGNDVQAHSADKSHDVTVNIAYSNFAKAKKVGPGAPAHTHLKTNATDQSAAPQFANALAGDFHQTGGSPTIDKGVNSNSNGSTDFDGDARIINGRTDIGADEFVPAPKAVTGAATALTKKRATLNGVVNPNDRATTYYFQWGSTTSYGHFTAVKGAGSGTSDVPVSARVSGLAPGTTYHFRLVATSSIGTNFGKDAVFRTLSSPPPKTSHFSGAFVASGRAKVVNGDARVKVRCPTNAAAPPGGGATLCAGTLTLTSKGKIQTSSGKKHAQLGTVSFAIPAGAKQTVFVPISSDGLSALDKKGHLKARAKVVSQDGQGTTRKRSRSVLLKLKR
jgi:hypothetical protein